MSYTKPKGIIFTDFDGTLFDSNKTIVSKNYEALEEAGRQGFVRVIATGRSLYSFRRASAGLDRKIGDYIDYLIFSSGAGTLEYSQNLETLIEAEALKAESAFSAAGLLFRHGIDFMIHSSVPENHRFTHIKANGCVNPDYYRRLKIYSDFALPLRPAEEDSELDAIEKICSAGVTQLIAVIPPASGSNSDKFQTELLEYLRLKLPDCSVIRTTSPIDHQSLWIEIFNPQVSKSQAASRLAERLGLGSEDCLAIGNDFNDEDLLAWAGRGITVAEAPEKIKNAFASAGPAADGAVAAAVTDFIS